MKANLKTLIIAVTLIAGVIITAFTLNTEMANDADPAVAVTAEYGQYIVRNTAMVLGNGQSDPDRQYSGTNMACASCHLDSGQSPGMLNLLQASSKYPRFSGRDGGIGDLRDRINGCMQRSMNGDPLPRNSIEMLAMETYINNLGEQFLAMGDTRRQQQEPELFEEPKRRASVENGKEIYEDRCQVCHGRNGEGLKASKNIAEGYLFPPLWGEDSYNNGAGMTRILTASRFIKARMPLGEPDLSNDQAYDVAAYVNSHERPIKSNLAADFPELERKPVDSPYLPYADPFPQEQHKLGPFDPIREYYKNLAISR